LISETMLGVHIYCKPSSLPLLVCWAPACCCVLLNNHHPELREVGLHRCFSAKPDT
jgi:hypothetical protein